MKMHHRSTIAARISTVILAFGFTLLGFLSLTMNHQVGAGNRTFDNAFSIVGATVSSLLGGIFLIAGSRRWNRGLPPA
jgi:hypothetical protein